MYIWTKGGTAIQSVLVIQVAWWVMMVAVAEVVVMVAVAAVTALALVMMLVTASGDYKL